MTTPLVTVVLPVHERPAESARAVASALAQTMSDLEVVVVDDHSAVPAAFPQLADPRLRILRHSANRGPAAARNTGVRAARGRYVAFLDCDDRWEPQKLARQLAVAEHAGGSHTAVVSGWRYEGRGGRGAAFIPKGAATPREFANGCWFCPGSTALMERATFDAVGPEDETLRRLEDYDWFLRFGLAGGRLLVADEPLATIAWRPRTDWLATSAGADALRVKYSGTALPAALRRRFNAYLDLCVASPLWYAGRRGAALLRLARSFAALPRLSLQIDDPWDVRTGMRPPVRGG